MPAELDYSSYLQLDSIVGSQRFNWIDELIETAHDSNGLELLDLL